jgi:hypothetical protein
MADTTVAVIMAAVMGIIAKVKTKYTGILKTLQLFGAFLVQLNPKK